MHYIDKELCGVTLRIASTLSSGIFAGAALYINCVEAPARSTHDAASAITMWKPSFNRAAFFMSKVGVISGLCSLGAYFCLYDKNRRSLEWLIAGTTMLTIIPYTLIFLRPVNNQLLETEKCISVKGDKWIVDNLAYWGKLHTVRTVLSLGAFGLMVFNLSSMAFQIASTLSCGICAGGSLYINAVELPANTTHDASSAITMWKPSFIRAKFFMQNVGTVSAISSLGAFACLHGSEKRSIEWLVAGGAMLMLGPYTAIFIAPLNSQLLETEKCISVKGDKWIVQNLANWGKLHAVRTVLTLGAFGLMVFTLAR